MQSIFPFSLREQERVDWQWAQGSLKSDPQNHAARALRCSAFAGLSQHAQPSEQLRQAPRAERGWRSGTRGWRQVLSKAQVQMAEKAPPWTRRCQTPAHPSWDEQENLREVTEDIPGSIKAPPSIAVPSTRTT